MPFFCTGAFTPFENIHPSAILAIFMQASLLQRVSRFAGWRSTSLLESAFRDAVRPLPSLQNLTTKSKGLTNHRITIEMSDSFTAFAASMPKKNYQKRLHDKRRSSFPLPTSPQKKLIPEVRLPRPKMPRNHHTFMLSTQSATMSSQNECLFSR